jgi:type II secretion system protein L
LESKYASLLLLKTIVLVPGQQVALNSVSIPSKQTRQIQQALPFMLEEGLANEIEDNFFALGPRDADGNLNVAIVTHQNMQYWLAQLEQSQLKADVLLAETLLIPASATQNTLVVGEQSSWLRQGQCQGEPQGLRFNNTLATTVLKSLDKETMSRGFTLMSAGGENAKRPLEHIKNTLEAYYASISPAQAGAENGAEQAEVSSEGETALSASDLISDIGTQETDALIQLQPHLLSPLYAFAEEILSGKANVLSQFNLLQGQYKAKGPGISLGFNWKPLAVVAAIWFISLMSLQLMNAAKFNREAEQYQQQAENLYRSYFPSDKRIVDVKSQTLAHLRRAGVTGQGAGLLELFHPAGKVVHQFNKQNSGSPLRINRVSFEERLKELRLDISAKKFDQLDQLKATLEKQGLSVEIGSAVAQGQGIESRIKIKRG